MCEALEELAGTHCETSDHQHTLQKGHAYLRQARVTQEDTDRKHLCGWLRAHNTLEYTDTPVCTLIGVKADSSIECDNAVSAGSQQPN